MLGVGVYMKFRLTGSKAKLPGAQEIDEVVK